MRLRRAARTRTVERVDETGIVDEIDVAVAIEVVARHAVPAHASFARSAGRVASTAMLGVVVIRDTLAIAWALPRRARQSA